MKESQPRRPDSKDKGCMTDDTIAVRISYQIGYQKASHSTKTIWIRKSSIRIDSDIWKTVARPNDAEIAYAPQAILFGQRGLYGLS